MAIDFEELPDREGCETFKAISQRAKAFSKYYGCDTKVIRTTALRGSESEFDWVVLVPRQALAAWDEYMSAQEEQNSENYIHALDYDEDGRTPDYDLSRQWQTYEPWESKPEPHFLDDEEAIQENEFDARCEPDPNWSDG